MSRGCCFLLCWGFQLWHRHVTQLRAEVGLPLRKREKCAFGSSRASSFCAAPAAVLLLANSLSSSSCSCPQSPAQPRFFLFPCVPAPSCSVIVTQHLCQQPGAALSALGSDVPFLQHLLGPARCGGGQWDKGYNPLPHVPPFPGPAPQPAFVTEAGLSAGDCESLVAAARSPLCIVRAERADGIQQITVRDCGNVLRPLCSRINRNLLGRK